MIKALIFDFDGLILDTESPQVDAWQEIYAEQGQVFPLQRWISEVIGSIDENFDPAAYLSELTGQSFASAGLRERVRAYCLEKQALMGALPGVETYLREGKRLGLKLAIASSSPRSWVEGYLHQLGIYESFQAVICRENGLRVKPAPDIFLKALSVLDVRPEEALVFEDSPNGILAANRAGIRAVAVPNAITAHGEMGRPDLVLRSLAELKLEELLRRFTSDISLEMPEDIAGIRVVELAAFKGSAEADLVDLCRERGKVSLSLVVKKEARVIAHLMFTPVRLDPPHPGWQGLGLGPVAVLPEFQGQGIGSRLIEEGLEKCRGLGIDFVVLLGNPAYYCRFGFIPASEFGLGNEYGQADAFQARELRPGVLRGAKGIVKYVAEFHEVGC
jgi:HAD superfamily hydrolase (TIGR01509 family)